MPDYALKELKSADAGDGRTAVTLNIETDKGPIRLTMNAAQLYHFITSLETVEQHASIDPVAGPAAAEAVRMRFHTVDGFNIGNALVNNTPSVAVILKAGNSMRAYAFDRHKAEALCRRVGDELPSLERLGTGH